QEGRDRDPDLPGQIELIERACGLATPAAREQARELGRGLAARYLGPYPLELDDRVKLSRRDGAFAMTVARKDVVIIWKEPFRPAGKATSPLGSWKERPNEFDFLEGGVYFGKAETFWRGSFHHNRIEPTRRSRAVRFYNESRAELER